MLRDIIFFPISSDEFLMPHLHPSLIPKVSAILVNTSMI